MTEGMKPFCHGQAGFGNGVFYSLLYHARIEMVVP
jgi:hypothetical protein